MREILFVLGAILFGLGLFFIYIAGSVFVTDWYLSDKQMRALWFFAGHLAVGGALMYWFRDVVRK